ncbi:FAD-dependent thymidylate synthase [Natroniella acetigena]|uniref:FAD-dependent thymidylate synthase n=1 Tax=Natroniella acetigena TaxID=52004 RepID=UPI003D15CEAC
MASYCLAGDTEVYTDHANRNVKVRTIKELYEMKKQYRDMTHIRSVDEENNILVNNKIEDVIKCGKKELFLVETEDGYRIKTTKKHRFLTDNGWKRLKEINDGDLIYVNGKQLYRDKEWLEKKYHREELSQKEMAELCNCSKHTIRKWIRKFGLQKEFGSWSRGAKPHDKGKTKENYEPLKIVSEKMKGNNNCGDMTKENNPNWKSDKITQSGGYSRSRRLQKYSKKGKCILCGKVTEKTEFHHKDGNPKNNELDNLEELCSTCHKVRHKGEVVKKIRLAKIKSIKYTGEEMTYDIEMKSPHHNFIANGFVVHNSQQSQRYVREKEQFDYIIPAKILESKEATQLFKENMNQQHQLYEQLTNKLVEKGYAEKEAIEAARYVLPNATETKIVVTMNARSLLHFFELRCCERAQREIRDLARLILKQVREVAPLIFAKAGPLCETEKRCKEGQMSCGRLDKLKEGDI